MTDQKQPVYEGDLPWEELSAPARRALSGAGFTSLEQLSQNSAEQIKKLHGIGPNAIETLRKALAAKGLSFRS